MSWTEDTIYLKFADEAEMLAALPAGWVVEGVPLTGSHQHSLDIVGIIEFDGVAVEGYHANLLLNGIELPPSLAPYVIPKPNNPVRVFAGYEQE